MIDIVKILLLPKNCIVLSLILMIIVLILMKSRKIETKWITLDLDKLNPAKNEKGELLLRERLLKEYKSFRVSIISEITKLRMFYRANFRESLLEYFVYLNGEDNAGIFKLKHTTLKIYELLLELTLKTVIAPMLIQIIFRNGFPKIGNFQKTNFKEYEESMEEFNAVCKEKYNTLLTTLELHMDIEWFDFSIDPTDYKKYYHNINKKCTESTFKETKIFFTILIQQRDAFIESIYVDFKKMFHSKEQCQKFCELALREIYE